MKKSRFTKEQYQGSKAPGNGLESLINSCLAAYNLQRCHDPGIPKIGTTLAEYTSARAIEHMAMEVTRFDGVRRLKKQVREVLAEIITQEAA